MNHSCLIILVWLYAVIILKAEKKRLSDIRMQSLLLIPVNQKRRSKRYVICLSTTQGPSRAHPGQQISSDHVDRSIFIFIDGSSFIH